MLIRKIIIQNFLCYHGLDNHIDFSDGLNIILGANGYGKSKLYDAFQWVFSDSITDNSPRATPGELTQTSTVKGELISEKAKAACAVGDSVEAKVCVEVETSGNTRIKKYQLVRTYRIRRVDESNWIEPGKSELQILEDYIVSFTPVPEEKHGAIRESLMPGDVRPYVWFQGERGINNLIDTSNNDSLKKVIRRLSYIDRWDKCIQVSQKAYDTVKNAFDLELRKSQKNQQEIDRLQTEARQLEKELTQVEQQITTAAQNRQAAEDKKNGLLTSIESAEKIGEFTQARDRIKKEYDVAVKQSDTFEERLSRNLFVDNWVLLGTASLLEKFEQKMEVYDDAVATRRAVENLHREETKKLQIRLPENVPEPMYVRQMLHEEHCRVCDRAAPKGSDAYRAITSLLMPEPKTTQPERPRANLKPLFRGLMQTALGLQSSIESVGQRVSQSMQEQQEMVERVRSTREELEEQGRQLQEQERISGITNARDIVNSMDRAIDDITRFTNLLDKHETRKEQIEKQQRKNDNDMNKLSEGQVPMHLTRKKDMLFDVMELAKRVKERKYQELIQQLETAANEHYRNINAPTGAFYGTIKFVPTIDGGYRPAIFDNDGREARNLNTSLVSSLKLSIIMAIVSANKTRDLAAHYPLISDAPVSDFDIVKTLTFLRETATTFTQSIVIMKELLVEDEEREGRYKPDDERLNELNDLVKNLDKKLAVFQLDMPDGVSNAFRHDIEVKIKKVAF